jgi:hypothetical protein
MLVFFFVKNKLEGSMSFDNATEEIIITQGLARLSLSLKEAFQLLCLGTLLSTYLFVMLKPNVIQNNKAIGEA